MRLLVLTSLSLLIGACSVATDTETDAAEGGDALSFPTQSPVDDTLPDVDAIGYEIELTVTDAPGQETFRAAVSGLYVATKSLTELSLDFEGNEIDDVTVNGAPAEHRRDDGHVIVKLPATAKGTSFNTRIAYHGAVGQAASMSSEPHTAFGGLMVQQSNAENKRIYSSMSWPSKARRWLPLRDHPSDVAQVRIKATWPKSFTVLANGARRSTTENADGSKTWQYEALTPMPTYDFHVAAYQGWKVGASRSSTSNIPITTYSYEQSANVVAEVYGDVPKAVDFYEKTFGPYRWGSLSFIQEPIFGGGMEHASVVAMDEDLFSNPSWTRYTALHELAHHWSGNLVHFRQWNDFWLSEGMTQYLTAKAVSDIDGADAGRTTLRGFFTDALDTEATNPHPVAPAGAEANIYDVYDSISYQKGALIVHMLEGIVGEQPMAAFLEGWFDRHAFGAAVSTDDFQRELERATGKDLGAFFAGFVRGVYHPELRVSLKPSGSGNATDIEVEQIQTQGPSEGFRFPLVVDVVAADGQTERVTIDLTGKTTTKRVQPSFAAKSVVVDPDEHAYAVVACDATTKCKSGFSCTTVRSGFSGCIPR
jgi:aminopeptidase N